MQFLRSYVADICPALAIVLYLVNSIGCNAQITQAMLRNDSYYKNGNIACLKCPAGYFVKKDCVTSYTQGKCQMCNPGVTYSEHETGLNICLTCTKCRADQEEMSPCNITKNTVCQCKKGTYYSKNATSNQCLPCRSSCPEEQVLQHKCNSTSDIVCVTVTSHSTVGIAVFFALLGTVLVIVAICACFFWRKSCDVLKPIPKKLTKPSKTSGSPNETDAQTKFLAQENKLYMMNDITEEEAINKTLIIFVDLVPANKFETFVLKLGLTNYEINLEKQDSRATEEQHYAMLLRLQRRDQKFDVNIWLSKLDNIRLGYIAEKISARLIEDGLFERSTSFI